MRTCVRGGFRLEYVTIHKKTDFSFGVTMGYTVVPNPAGWDLFEMEEVTFPASRDIHNVMADWLRMIVRFYNVCSECLRLGQWEHSACPKCRTRKEDTCCICWDPTFSCPLGCNHVLHMSCLLRMMSVETKYSHHCPMCRNDISLDHDLNILLSRNREEGPLEN